MSDEKKTGFFTDDKGNPSITRILSAMTCLVGLGMGIIGAIQGKMDLSLTGLASSFVLAGLGLKALGKKLENK